MSYFLDPPVLFLLGILVYRLSRRFKWSLNTTVVMMGVISLGFFMGGSTLLYLDVLGWPLPPTPGPVWMFHTNITGIEKADVHIAPAVLMLLAYPLWHISGYLLDLRSDMGSFLIRVVSFNDVKSRRKRPETDYKVVRGPSPRENTRIAINKLGGIDNFVKERDKVIIKVNICGGNPEIPGSYTSTEVVDELVRMIREVGAEPTIVDSDMIWTKFAPVAEAEKWVEWAEKANVLLVNLAEKERVRFNFGPDSATGIVPVSKLMVEADVIISVPTMKTHLLTKVTLGMKNMYGTFPEENKAKYHRFGIEDVIYEVNKAFTPHLTVIDGTMGGEAFGPLSCKPVEFQTIIASNDVVAADSVASQLMGYDPFDIKHIKKAHEEGLGSADVTFDLATLPYAHEKDGKWEKPDPSVTDLYESLVEGFLLLPGMQGFFDVAADFVLFDLATLPVFKDLTPEIERLFNYVLSDILSAILRSGYRPRELSATEVWKRAAQARSRLKRADRGAMIDVKKSVEEYINQVWEEIFT